MAPLLELTNVSKTFGGLLRRRRVAAVRDVSFSLAGDSPEVLTLLGQSGSRRRPVSSRLSKTCPCTITRAMSPRKASMYGSRRWRGAAGPEAGAFAEVTRDPVGS